MSSVITLTRPPIGIRAIEQRRRTAHHVDARGGSRIDCDAVVARLTRQVTHALAILQNLHAVAVETTNHGTRRRRSEAARRNPWLALEGGPQRHLELLGEILSCEHGRRLVHLELAASLAA